MKSRSSAKRGFADGYKTYNTSYGYGNRNEWKESFYKRFTHEQAKEILQNDNDPFTLLGLKHGATTQEIKTAFRTLIMFWHPDKNKSENAEEMTKKLIAAYSLLT